VAVAEAAAGSPPFWSVLLLLVPVACGRLGRRATLLVDRSAFRGWLSHPCSGLPDPHTSRDQLPFSFEAITYSLRLTPAPKRRLFAWRLIVVVVSPLEGRRTLTSE